MAPAPPRPPVHRQPALLMQMFNDPQPVLDRMRVEYGPVVGLGLGPVKMAIVGGPAEVRRSTQLHRRRSAVHTPLAILTSESFWRARQCMSA